MPESMHERLIRSELDDDHPGVAILLYLDALLSGDGVGARSYSGVLAVEVRDEVQRLYGSEAPLLPEEVWTPWQRLYWEWLVRPPAESKAFAGEVGALRPPETEADLMVMRECSGQSPVNMRSHLPLGPAVQRALAALATSKDAKATEAVLQVLVRVCLAAIQYGGPSSSNRPPSFLKQWRALFEQAGHVELWDRLTAE